MAEDLWKYLPASQDYASSVFITIARAAAGIYELLLLRCQTWPYKLVGLLKEVEADREVAVAELLTAPPCLLDGFSAAIQRQIALMTESERSTMQPLRTQLLVALEMLVGNTFATERVHSRNLRRRMGRVQTHHVMVHDLATFHMGRNEPPYADAFLVREKTDIGKDTGKHGVPSLSVSGGKQ